MIMFGERDPFELLGGWQLCIVSQIHRERPVHQQIHICHKRGYEQGFLIKTLTLCILAD